MRYLTKTSFVFYLIQTFVSISESNKICNSTHDLPIDSTRFMTIDENQKLIIFSDKEFFELEPISIKLRPKITRNKKLEDLSKELVPPINVSFQNLYVYLENFDIKRMWTFNSFWTHIRTENANNFRYFDIFVCGDNTIGLSEKPSENGNRTGISLNYNITQSPSLSYTLKTRKVNGKYEIKRMLSNSSMALSYETDFFNDLNGKPITAAFCLMTDSGKEMLHLFASRYVCRMEISDEWLPFCQIQDINQWIDCGDTSKSTTGDGLKRDDSGLDIIWIVAIILSLIVCAIIAAICVFIYLIIDVLKRTKKLREALKKPSLSSPKVHKEVKPIEKTNQISTTDSFERTTKHY